MLKKTKMFAGDPAPFVMELPPYHVPSVTNVLRATWERGWSFIKRAGSVIVISSIVLWFLQAFGTENEKITAVIPIMEHGEDSNLFMVTKKGIVKKLIANDMELGIQTRS